MFSAVLRWITDQKPGGESTHNFESFFVHSTLCGVIICQVLDPPGTVTIIPSTVGYIQEAAEIYLVQFERI